MPEIERKFLVQYLPEELEKYQSVEIEQNYISFQPEKRIRKLSESYFFTEKSEGSLAREEHERPISKQEYLRLQESCSFVSLHKTRYYIPLEDGLIAELDLFHGILEGLMTVEVEFPDVVTANAFQAREWFGTEVTENPNYKNKQLIQKPPKSL
ncbi:MAG: CYTH domain-containing protein [Bacilli bacterium]|nr:CYTH domain-containing protein [Bacilli bacterium]MBN2877646.1 CYTH domain-containing protein [Bacilli bacterium]